MMIIYKKDRELEALEGSSGASDIKIISGNFGAVDFASIEILSGHASRNAPILFHVSGAQNG
jgi:hypothetical protein